MKTKTLLITMLLFFIIAFYVELNAQMTYEKVKIIANKDVPVNSLSQKELKNIFMGKKTKWQDKTSIKFTLLNRETDYKKFLELIDYSAAKYERYWKKQVFTGKAKMPKTVKTAEEMIQYISENQGAIGYILTDKIDNENIKIISIMED